MNQKWRQQAHCRNTNPNHYDTNGQSSIQAEMLCAGCPVQPECAEDALQPINVSLIIRNVLGVVLDEPDDVVPQTGTIRAGVAT